MLYYLKKAKKLPDYLGYFCKKFCYQEEPNIAQYGHTVNNFYEVCQIC